MTKGNVESKPGIFHRKTFSWTIQITEILQMGRESLWTSVVYEKELKSLFLVIRTMNDACVLFEGAGQVQLLSVKELYQGILHHLDLVCVPNDFTNCIQEVQKAKFSIHHIKRNWFELQRRNVISFPLHYGPPGHIRVAEYPEYLSDQLQCGRCLSPIQMNTTFYIQSTPYVRMGTQECASCTKQEHNQRMNTDIHSSICRMLLNTLRIIGVIVQDRLNKLLRLEREMSML